MNSQNVHVCMSQMKRSILNLSLYTMEAHVHQVTWCLVSDYNQCWQCNDEFEWLQLILYFPAHQQKLQLRKKRKKEREALGDKVCEFYISCSSSSLVQVYSTNQIIHLKSLTTNANNSLFLLFVLHKHAGTSKRSPKDHWKSESIWWDNSRPRGWGGMNMSPEVYMSKNDCVW